MGVFIFGIDCPVLPLGIVNGWPSSASFVTILQFYIMNQKREKV